MSIRIGKRAIWGRKQAMSDNSMAAGAAEETIVLEETKYGAFQVKVRSGCATFVVDEPFGMGGLASGPTPYDLLSAALGTCSMMTMRLFATKHKFPLDHIRIRISHSRNGLYAEDRFVKHIHLTGALSEGQRQKLAEISDYAPVQLTIARGSEVQTILLSNDPLRDAATTRCQHMRDLREAVHRTVRN